MVVTHGPFLEAGEYLGTQARRPVMWLWASSPLDSIGQVIRPRSVISLLFTNSTPSSLLGPTHTSLGAPIIKQQQQREQSPRVRQRARLSKSSQLPHRSFCRHIAMPVQLVLLVRRWRKRGNLMGVETKRHVRATIKKPTANP